MPTVYLEWSPTTNPGAAPSWERIPLADIRAIDINRGRNRELDQYQAGRMTVVLDNRDRLYDPMYTAGANFGNVKPMRRIRLRAVWDTTYDLFSGFVDSWDQDYDQSKEAVCVVTATDGFKVLERGELMSSAYAEEVDADRPVHWWRLGEAVGSTVAVDHGSAPAAGTYGPSGVTLGATSLIANDSDTSATFTEGGGGYMRAELAAPTAAPYSIEFVLNSEANGLSRVLAVDGSSVAPISTLLASITVGDDGAGNGTVNFTGPGVLATGWTVGTATHIALTVDGGGVPRTYVNGTLSNTGSAGLTTGDAAFLQLGAGSIGAGTFGGTLDEFCVYNSALSATRIAAHASARSAPWNADTTGARIGRLLDAIGWPTADRDVDTGESTLQSANFNGQSALAHAQLVRDTEYGELFIAPDGKVTFLSRHGKWKPPYNSPVATLSDDGADVGYGTLKFNYDDQLIRNRVTIGYTAGLTFTANSTGSQDEFRIQSYSKTGLIGNTDSEAVDQANYITGRYDEPLLRVQGVTITPQRNPTVSFPKVLALDLVYQVNVERTPQGVGTAIDQNHTVEGISHHIEPKFWRTNLQLSPADTPGAFILDSTSQGILDTHTLGW